MDDEFDEIPKSSNDDTLLDDSDETAPRAVRFPTNHRQVLVTLVVVEENYKVIADRVGFMPGANSRI